MAHPFHVIESNEDGDEFPIRQNRSRVRLDSLAFLSIPGKSRANGTDVGSDLSRQPPKAKVDKKSLQNEKAKFQSYMQEKERQLRDREADLEVEAVLFQNDMRDKELWLQKEKATMKNEIDQLQALQEQEAKLRTDMRNKELQFHNEKENLQNEIVELKAERDRFQQRAQLREEESTDTTECGTNKINAEEERRTGDRMKEATRSTNTIAKSSLNQSTKKAYNESSGKASLIDATNGRPHDTMEGDVIDDFRSADFDNHNDDGAFYDENGCINDYRFGNNSHGRAPTDEHGGSRVGIVTKVGRRTENAARGGMDEGDIEELAVEIMNQPDFNGQGDSALRNVGESLGANAKSVGDTAHNSGGAATATHKVHLMMNSHHTKSHVLSDSGNSFFVQKDERVGRPTTYSPSASVKSVLQLNTLSLTAGQTTSQEFAGPKAELHKLYDSLDILLCQAMNQPFQELPQFLVDGLEQDTKQTFVGKKKPRANNKPI
ncbi:MAG: hypothetical protein SGARI_001856, partial [Bacillariaceae sp.]